ncbi:MAG: YifB family Mg chelatase-like AAA ATPase [Leptospira sp.]|nr:YifB family Mg chelatase-like AAA ATPase [Leptospira sp.]
MKGKSSKVKSICRYENSTIIVDVEIYIRRGIPGFQISGMPSRNIRDSRDRIRACLEESGFIFPMSNITINLSPSEIPKKGSHFDLAIAIGILKATNQIQNHWLDQNLVALGELSLNGNINRINYLSDLLSEEFGKELKFILPIDNQNEAVYFLNNNVIFMEKLSEIRKVTIPSQLKDISIQNSKNEESKNNITNFETLPHLDLYPSQELAWEGLVIALSGRHHILFTGMPGSGKTMLGELASQIQSTPAPNEWKEILTRNSSLQLDINKPIRPYRAPHHSITGAGLIGGGSSIDIGEISNAHLGILFLDEISEMQNKILQNLREPLEKGKISLSRSNRFYAFPAQFQLIATSNLCPCGQYSSLSSQCICKKEQVRSYLGKLSGPLLDRIDIIIEISNDQKNSSRKIIDLNEAIEKIQRTINYQRKRNYKLSQGKIVYNSEIQEGMYYLMNWKERDIHSWNLFTREFNLGIREREKILGIARTIADLDNETTVSRLNLLSALALRDGSKSINSIAA